VDQSTVFITKIEIPKDDGEIRGNSLGLISWFLLQNG